MERKDNSCILSVIQNITLLIPDLFVPRNVCVKFGDILSEAANMSTSKLLVFIDGLDVFEETYQPYSLEWLPSPVPEVPIAIAFYF